MSVPAPPTITNAPSPAPTRLDPVNFRERADAYHSWLVPFVNSQLPPLINWIRARANDVLGWANATEANRILAQQAATAVAAANPVANAAAAAQSAADAAAFAAQAQATNPDSPIRLNPRFIRENLTIPAAYNAATAGPITVSDGATVVVQDNATWSIH
jgi:hypothetical protein